MAQSVHSIWIQPQSHQRQEKEKAPAKQVRQSDHKVKDRRKISSRIYIIIYNSQVIKIIKKSKLSHHILKNNHFVMR